MNMAGKQHVDVEMEESPNENRKIRHTILDNFRKLTLDKEKIRLNSGLLLLKQVCENKDTEKGKIELKYALGRLIRGLGASKNTSKIGFYTVLVALLNSVGDLSISEILEYSKNELHSSGSNSKSENADIFTGQILLFGAIIRSNFYEKATLDENKYLIEQLLAAGRKRDYLYLSCIMFIIELCEKVSESDFKSIIWPFLRTEIGKPWNEQNIDTLYLLYTLRKRFPKVVNKKFMQQALHADDVHSKQNFKELTSILLNIPRITVSNHPFYEIICKNICVENSAVEFIKEIDVNLEKFNYNRHLVATLMITYCARSTTNSEIIPDLLNKNFIQHTLQYFKSVRSSKNPETLQEAVYKLFEVTIDVLKRDDTKSDVKIAVIKKLLFSPGIFIFEKMTRSKIVQRIISTLCFDGLNELSNMYKDVILRNNNRLMDDDRSQLFLNRDRVYASQLLVKILSHHKTIEKVDWKIEQLCFFIDLSLFRNENVSVELAATLKETFYRSLALKLPKLNDLRNVLSSLINHINNRLQQQHILRNPLSDETMELWNKSLTQIGKLESKHKKLYIVFHTLFLHMTLQLFNDVKLATDSLKEVFCCYERIRVEKKQVVATDTDDPLWIEVVVDLFLNLLSHKSYLLRNLISCVFPHLCKYLNVTAMHQILDIMDPKNEGNPLIDSDDSESECEGADSTSNEESEDSTEDDEETIENVNDKLKMAVQVALGGCKSDEEDIDLDELSESEGKQLDEALATAFKQFKPNIGKKSNKQKKEDEALTHFRVRVLDLVDLYLDSEPSMHLCLEIMVILLRSLEFAIKDDHQKPLVNRLRSTLKKLSNVKEFNSVNDIDDLVLSDLFNSLLEKGTKNHFVMQEINDKISECCLFIIKCTEYLNLVEEVPKKVKKHLKKSISKTITDALEMFFMKRESYIPYGLFKSILQTNWDGNYKINDKIVRYIFENEVRPYRKCQGLELLKISFGNNRLLSVANEHVEQFLQNFQENTINFFSNTKPANINEKFVRELISTLSVLKNSVIDQNRLNWVEIGERLKEFRANIEFTKETRLAYNKLCRVLKIDGAVTFKDTLIKLGDIENEEEVKRVHTESKNDKKSKNRKQKRGNLRKETRALRMQSLSEGFAINFSEADLTEERGEKRLRAVDDDLTEKLNGIKSKRSRKKLTK